MTTETPDKWKLKIDFSEVKHCNFKQAIQYMQLGYAVAEMKDFKPEKVYVWDKEFFQVNLHLGTYIQTSTFDMFTNKDLDRDFILVDIEEVTPMIKGSSKPDVEYDEFEQHKQGAEILVKELEVLKPPMFFEDNQGQIINVCQIVRLNVNNILVMSNGEELGYYGDNLKKLKEFLKLHGIFGKDN